MWACVIMHQDTRILVQKRDNNRTENLGDVMLGIKNTSNYDQVCFPTTIIPPQTITLPLPNLSLSSKQLSAKRSPRRRKTRILPPAKLELKWDSSVNKTLAHWARVLRKWRRAQSNRRLRLRGLMMCPTYGRLALIGSAFLQRRFRTVCLEMSN